MDWRERDGIRWLEASLPGATAAFSTRLGGRSRGAFESLNLGLFTDDEPEAVLANRAGLSAALARPGDGVLIGHQVHGDGLLRRERAPEPNPWGGGARAPESDAQATANPALTPFVQVADCLPVAVAGDGGVAMLHCGWRGLAAGLVGRGAEEVRATAAAIGPGIGRCCYEVGEEVLAQFERPRPGHRRRPDARPARGRAAAARRRRRGRGRGGGPVHQLRVRELFFSHRRDGGRTGRQGGLVWIDA